LAFDLHLSLSDMGLPMTELCMKRRTQKAQRGFTLLEALIVMAIIAILVATSVLSIQRLLAGTRSDAAANVVTSQLRGARELAITRRHNVQVWFDTAVAAPDFAPHVRYQEMAITGVTETLPAAVSIPLPPNTNFMLQAGQGDTPMGFGNGAPVFISGVSGGPPTMYFTTTGAFVASGAPINGTVYVGIANTPSSERAVTILGSTGRVRTYYWIGVGTTTPTGWRE
jgi:prepilin-type N-terminal cleavage/methylation domain-containing protein